jgi:hypothetical protein
MATSILHSPAAFKNKMRWAGIEEDHQVIILSKYKNLQQFAQSCGVNPDQVDDNSLLKKVVTARYQVDIEGTLTDRWLWRPSRTESDPIEPQICFQIRNLFWEAYHMLAVDTKHRHDAHNADDLPRPIHNLEREDRRDSIKRELKDMIGIYEGRWEPAHCIEDDIGAMLNRDRLDRYIAPSDCPDRRQELARAPARTNKWRPKAAGTPLWIASLMDASEEVQPTTVEVNTTYDLDFALRRRALAIVFHDLMTFTATERWRTTLLKAMDEEVIVPGDSAPGLADVLAADKVLWMLIAEHCRKGIKRVLDTRPMQDAFDKYVTDNQVTRLLHCRPKTHLVSGGPKPQATVPKVADSTQRTGTSPKANPKGKTKRQKKADKKNKELQDLRTRVKQQGTSQDNNQSRPQKGAKRKGKKPKGPNAKRKKNDSFQALPEPLIGGQAKSSNGTPFCFGFNLGKCDTCKPGDKCSRGLHKCMKPGCNANHAYVDFHKNDKV